MVASDPFSFDFAKVYRSVMVLFFLACAFSTFQTSLPSDGRITTSLSLKGGRTTRVIQAGEAAFEVMSDGITLDFGGGMISGGDSSTKALDRDEGVGLSLVGRHDVTIKNLKVQGFRFNIALKNCRNINIENCNVSLSRSLPMEPEVFLDLRHSDTWLGYGAGILLQSSNDNLIVGCTGTSSQDGILLIESDKNKVSNCNFSYNSGWGIGMLRSSENIICWNKADFVNRSWAGGWGADSAALAMADSCHKNFIVGNSLTHGGDGFFLTDSVNGGFSEIDHRFHFAGPSNENVIAENDGSYSSHNAFESTFSSDNTFLGNKADYSEYGFWIGFSRENFFSDNDARFNRHDGFASGMGSGSTFLGNSLDGNEESAFHFWTDKGAAEEQAPNYDQFLQDNKFGKGTKFKIENAKVTGPDAPEGSARRGEVDSVKLRDTVSMPLHEIEATKPPGWKTYSEQREVPKGTQWLRAGTFAPADSRSDLATWYQPSSNSVELFLLKPGVSITAPFGLTYGKTPGLKDVRQVKLQTSLSKNRIGSEQPYQIILDSADNKKHQKIDLILSSVVWNCSWFRWDIPSRLNYDNELGWNDLFKSNPLIRSTSSQLDSDFSYRSPIAGLPKEYFALLATTKANFSEGTYGFDTISDDGIEVFLDDKKIISRWNHHGATPDHIEMTIAAGVHTVRVRYCQEDGGAVLKVNWKLLQQ